ncbi:hypothetical protein PLICRDRAFT_108674 [Plicaturopsis crispa FD-325 SS-3]|nr:hypothetical protein PLICRDRAFT_108674 [Plicaturopsis crispa FD-325 SS-3]
MPSLPWPFSSSPPSPPPPSPSPPAAPPKDDSKDGAPTFPSLPSLNLTTSLTSLPAPLPPLPPPLLFLTAFSLGSTLTLGCVGAWTRYGRRVRTGDWVTPDMFKRGRWVRGVVTSVGDADNFRLYHTPGVGWRWPLKFRRIPSASNKGLKDQTIHVRMAGVDAPEAAHFGRPAQPYAPEALAWLKAQIEGKTVWCQVLRRDQYHRIVSTVLLPPRLLPGALVPGKSLSLEMLRAGWVTTYEQAGAEYGRWGKDEFLRIEGEAKAAKRGMWKYGTDSETPAEFKRRYANGTPAEQAKQMAVSKEPRGDKAERKGWLRFFTRAF